MDLAQDKDIEARVRFHVLECVSRKEERVSRKHISVSRK